MLTALVQMSYLKAKKGRSMDHWFGPLPPDEEMLEQGAQVSSLTNQQILTWLGMVGGGGQKYGLLKRGSAILRRERRKKEDT